MVCVGKYLFVRHNLLMLLWSLLQPCLCLCTELNWFIFYVEGNSILFILLNWFHLLVCCITISSRKLIKLTCWLNYVDSSLYNEDWLLFRTQVCKIMAMETLEVMLYNAPPNYIYCRPLSFISVSCSFSLVQCQRHSTSLNFIVVW